MHTPALLFYIVKLPLHTLPAHYIYPMKLKDGFKGERSLVLPKAVTDLILRDPLASLIYITDIGYYPNAKHHFRSRQAPIHQYVFIYCVNGKGWYEINGRRFNVVRNQYFILPSGLPHSYGSADDEPWTIYWIHFSGPLAAHYAPEENGPHDVTPSMESRINVRNNLFEEIFTTLQASFAIGSVRYAMASFHHYLASLRYIDQFRHASPQPEAASPKRRQRAEQYSNAELERILTHYFTENIERALTLKEIATYVGLSTSAVSSKFKSFTGHSPLQYFNLMKIRCACQLLDSTPLTISQVSLKLGIEDPYYFSRLFSKTMGLSPKAYRTRLRP